MTLSDLESLLHNPDPRAIFGGDIDAKLKELRIACHPDRHPTEAKRAEAIYVRLGELADEARTPPLALTSPKRTYSLVRRLAVGDVSDIHLATADGTTYLLKASRIRGGDALLKSEKEHVAKILTAAGDTSYRHYFPTLSESFAVKDKIPKRVNVYTYDSGFYTVEQVREKHPNGLDGRHLAWVFKRLLTGLGFTHQAGIVHGAPTPGHVLIHPENHGVRLAGWVHATTMGGKITTAPARYAGWYPTEVQRKEGVGSATDIYLAAKTVLYIGGGDVERGTLPSGCPREMALFLKSCLVDGPRMRPQDAWSLLDDFDALLRDLFGPPKFHVLTMN